MLIVNLLIIVALASYRQLVDNTAQPTEKQRDYGVASDITLADMKKKLLGSALAIGVIAVLADLMKLTSAAADFTTTLPLIVMSFVFLIFAIAAFFNSKSYRRIGSLIFLKIGRLQFCLASLIARDR